MRKVGVVMGSASDLPVVEKAIGVLQQYGVPYEVRVLSAHRCPDQAREFAAGARASGFSVLIAAAGMAAHLAGALAANTTLPVIGIPCKSAIDGAKNAAILAVEILALSEPELAEKLEQTRRKETEQVLARDREVMEKYRQQ